MRTLANHSLWIHFLRYEELQRLVREKMLDYVVRAGNTQQEEAYGLERVPLDELWASDAPHQVTIPVLGQALRPVQLLGEMVSTTRY
jgi:hypothetical protein